MKAPAFLFYTGDFLSSPDVILMDTHEVGAYILLLCHSWQGDQPGYLRNDEDRLRRMARLLPEQWAISRELLLSKFPLVPDEPALRYNPRMVKEAAKQREHREKRSRAGQASVAKRAAKATSVQQTLSKNESTVTRTRSCSATVLENSTNVKLEPNICSEKEQQQTNLSVSLSTLSSLRSEREAVKAATPKLDSKKRLKQSSFSPPTLADVQDFAADMHPADAGAQQEVNAFLDHYQSNGWRVGGKTPMVDWRASFRNWMRRKSHFLPATSADSAATPTRARATPKSSTDPARWS